MDKAHKWLRPVEPAQPTKRGVECVVAAAIGLAALLHACGLHRSASVWQAWNLVVVGLESVREPIPSVHPRARDKCAGAEATLAEPRGERLDLRRHLLTVEVADSVPHGQQATEDRRVAHGRERCICERLREPRAVALQPLERGNACVIRSVGPDRV